MNLMTQDLVIHNSKLFLSKINMLHINAYWKNLYLILIIRSIGCIYQMNKDPLMIADINITIVATIIVAIHQANISKWTSIRSIMIISIILNSTKI